MRRPVSTYRLQVRAGFDLDRVAEIADYVHALGADWLYLSPLLESEAGSDHGYDVVDHSRVDPARGGAEGLARAVAAARAHDLGVLVDTVPNHVGVATPAAMRWWWDVLEHGRSSRFAEAFDIDWEFGGGRLRLPVLGSAGDVASLRLVEADAPGPAHDDADEPRFELHYWDHRFPVASGTAVAGDDPVAVHDRQHYELIDWRRADFDLNYRRFFAVNTLAAIRVEVPWVFDESHAEIVRWLREGLADGLRVDHPDGLRDPGGYLDRLAAATGPAYVLVEKILEGDEPLPPHWEADGTSGYDALDDIDRVFVDPAGEAALDALDTELRGGTPAPAWPDLIHGTKRAIADGILRSEVLRLTRELVAPGRSPADRVRRTLQSPADSRTLRTPTHDAVTDGVRKVSERSDDSRSLRTRSTEVVADAVAEVLSCFPVYRSYLPYGREHLEHAVREARSRRPELAGTIDAVAAVLGDPEHPAAVRFQQTSGMVMAKGVEDTAFYRATRLGTLTEVGADPSEFAIDVPTLHERFARRQAEWPHSMTTLSTHDTKRGEDVRARLSVLAEVPEWWAAALGELRAIAPTGDGPFDALLWQAIVGSWPASRERLHAYAEKASREASVSTTWTAPDEAFEQRMHRAVDAAFDDPRAREIVEGLVAELSAPGWSNSLSAKLVQLAGPGVPDVYQGSELWETSLVDPDNRRPVDFGERRRLLAEIDAGALPPVDETGAAKLLATSRVLRLRRDRPELFTRYTPMAVTGPAAAHAIAFDRGGALAVATRLPVGLAARGDDPWAGTVLLRHSGPTVDVLTGRRFEGGAVPLGELLATYPVALLGPA
ncbi:malto-oligosyltrehalose synthase [Agromyces mangrovi Wang et al. 2018]|uniref:malto-oligosyltrehalose synthase n=1 Tax=Agromyces mangrovi TaxID=1858653 RepID=UPI002573311F|nr:malto-oligosyltrehalose synthase [Agromyces mangrovi]BDZ64945.1 malto-oligosyltrehalose synthase [Agromyces mangrovi]